MGDLRLEECSSVTHCDLQVFCSVEDLSHYDQCVINLRNW